MRPKWTQLQVHFRLGSVIRSIIPDSDGRAEAAGGSLCRHQSQYPSSRPLQKLSPILHTFSDFISSLPSSWHLVIKMIKFGLSTLLVILLPTDLRIMIVLPRNRTTCPVHAYQIRLEWENRTFLLSYELSCINGICERTWKLFFDFKRWYPQFLQHSSRAHFSPGKTKYREDWF